MTRRPERSQPSTGRNGSAPPSPHGSVSDRMGGPDCSGVCTPRSTALCAALLIAAGAAVYSNSFGGGFFLDDLDDIVENEAIKGSILGGGWLKTMDRPMVTLSLAINYHFGGLNIWGYHAVNVAIHLLAGLILFGLVRRTLRLERMPDSFREAATGLALACALIWLVHPLQTGSVTYLIQRCESMMGLFYLATLYCVVRGATATRGRWWYVAAVAACIAGMTCKAVMVTAPLVVLLHDRAFLGGTFVEAVRRRWALYLGLAGSLLFLSDGGLIPNLVGVVRTVEEGPTASVPGLLGGHSAWEYASAQPAVILHYLKLSFWPAGLCLDYVWQPAKEWREWAPQTIVIAALLSVTSWACWRTPAAGFLGAWFFLVLAPTSSIRPLNNIAFEHRMYLPLAAVVVVVVCAAYGLLMRIADRRGSPRRSAAVAGVVAAACLALALGLASVRRNELYRSEIAMWEDVVDKRPANPRARTYYGTSLARVHRRDKGIVQLRRALELNPHYPEARVNLGLLLVDGGNLDEAAGLFEQVLRQYPRRAKAHRGLGMVRSRQGRIQEAAMHFGTALALNPSDFDSHWMLAALLSLAGRNEDAIAHYREAIRLKPDSVVAHLNLGAILHKANRLDEAIAHYQAALRVDPEQIEAYANLGAAWRAKGDLDRAIAYYEAALKRDPAHVNSRINLGNALLQKGERSRAIEAYQEASRLQPTNPIPHEKLGAAFLESGDLEMAETHLAEAVRLRPNQSGAHYRMGLLRERQGRNHEAISSYREVLRIMPNHQEAAARLRELEQPTTQAVGG